MENNELYSFGDLPISELMHALTSPIDVDSDDVLDEDIEHSGIKGMKWGIRRFQNRDGSLTPAGKKRYNQELSKVRAAEKVLKNKQATKAKIDKLNERKKAVEEGEEELKSVAGRSKSTPKKDASTNVEATPKKQTAKNLSDDELNTAIKRMELEKRYNTLQNELNPKKESMGRDFVKKLSKNVLDGTAEAGKNVAKTFMEKKLKEMLGVDDKTVEKAKTALEKLKEQADEIKTRKEMLENQAKIDELTSVNKRSQKIERELDAVRTEKQLLAEEKQLEYLKREKAQGWPEDKKKKNNNNNNDSNKNDKKDKKNQNNK